MTTILERAVNIAIIVILLLPITVGTIGCSNTEDPLEPTTDLTKDTAVGVFASAKHNNTAPAAPQMPGVGIPRVTEVGFYHDWKLEKPISTPVQPGKTIYIKIVFSEPMKHVVSDGKEAKPIIYHKVDKGQQIRFKMAAHGASGEDFVSGDAKPLHGGTDDYLCKLIVPDAKNITLCVGKWNIDLQGNPLEKFYRHPVKVEVRQPPTPEPTGQVETADQEDVMDEPDEIANPIAEDVIRRYPAPPIEIEEPVTHYHYNGVVVGDILPPSAWVLDFPGPFRHYTPPRSSPRDFVGRVAMPVQDNYNPTWARAGDVAPVSKVIVTITQGPRRGEWVITDEGGYYHFKDVSGDNLYLRVERAYLEPKEVIVHRHRPTILQRMGPNRVFIHQYHEQENTPGTILMGLRWPDAIRHILESETLSHDPLWIMTLRQGGRPVSGLYSSKEGVITIVNTIERKGKINYTILAHELAHARQHAIAVTHGGSNSRQWENTPEARAYKQAWEKDRREAPGELYLVDGDDHLSATLLENAAGFCEFYWTLRLGVDDYEDGLSPALSMRTRAPNRWKWAETHLNTR